MKPGPAGRNEGLSDEQWREIRELNGRTLTEDLWHYARQLNGKVSPQYQSRLEDWEYLRSIGARDPGTW